MRKQQHFLYILPLAILLFFGCKARNTQENPSVVLNKQQEKNFVQPENIILMIGDGMGLSQITAGMIANNNKLHLEDFSYIGLIKTQSFDNLITDSAAGATAFSAGKKTYNGAIGVDSDTIAVETILEIAGNGKYATGLVATSSITHATPASFFAHQPSRSMDEAIARDMLSAPVDFFIGGGKDFFDKRADEANLLDSLRTKGFEIHDNIDNISSSSQSKVAGFIAGKQPISILLGRKDILPRATKKALDYLSRNENFFLVIEGSQIDWAGHSNDSEGIIAEMIDFDQAIGVIMEYAKRDGNTLVVVTADHETGGYSILGGDNSGTIKGGFTTKGHTGSLIPVFAFGPGAESFSGIYENTEIFEKLLKLTQK